MPSKEEKHILDSYNTGAKKYCDHWSVPHVFTEVDRQSGEMIIKIIGLTLPLVVFLPHLRLIHMLIGVAAIAILLTVSFFNEKVKCLRTTLVIVLIVSVVKIVSRLFGFYYPFDALVIFVLLAVYYALFNLDHLKQNVLKWPKNGWLSYFIIYTLFSIAGLVAYAYFSKNIGLVENLRGMGLLQLVFVGAGFSILNAFYEEFLFRGCLTTSLMNYPNGLTIVAQACAFAIMHYAAGFPGGVSGLILTFIYGVFMGHLFIKFRSIWPCILSHILCDASVFSLILIKQLD